VSAEFPLARREGLITEELDGELLVYDSESNMAHALDPDAAALWRACDGHTNTHTLAVRSHTSEDKARDTLARLGQFGLLQVADADQDGDTRRSALRKIGIAGVGVAAINSILVPTAAAAGSCTPPGGLVGFPDAPPCCPGSHAISNPVGGPPECCIPAGACAIVLAHNVFEPNDCCNRTGTPDTSCPSGLRCT
jgi:hypothetical protein